MSTSRRDLLIGAGAAAVSSLWGCGSSSTFTPSGGGSPAPQTGYDVIVIGAGAAGIAAARAVQTANRSVLVLEAQDHIGGRCHSETTFPIPFDIGAQFVGQATSLNNFLYPLMRQMGITLVRGEKVPRHFFDPKTGSDAEATAFYATYGLVAGSLLSAGAAIELGARDASVSDVVKAAGLENASYLKLVYELLMSVIDGGSAETQSTLDLYNITRYVPAAFAYPPKDTFLIPSGYGTFIARLAKGLSIQTSSPVSSIDYHGHLVTVKTTHGQSYTARAVIVTASVNVLKSGSIAFKPEMPARYVSALSGLTMGHVWKGMLEFRGRPFQGRINVKPGEMFSAIGLANRYSTQFFGNYFAQQYPNLKDTYLMSIAEGEPGVRLEKMGPAQAGKTLCAQLEAPFPGITNAWTGRILTSNWLSNPYTRGCISYATPGNASARVQLSKPIAKKLWFAGEAISVHSHSLVNGAWATGTDAAYGALFAIGALTRSRRHAQSPTQRQEEHQP